MYNSQEIAGRIKLQAKQQNKSLSALLSECGMGKNTVAKIGNGTDILTLNFAKIADSLGCSVDYLLGREGKREESPPISEDRLTVEQMELVRLFESASPSLRAAALAVLKSAEEQSNQQDRASR